ncbi:hypothetical protein [Marinibacterium profundimaris]|uniref:Lipopolysaccharide export system protein LptC n=1 Tax=Marinibacterium profundimaris TaxID=1679460 RepID=A0A225NRL7_9RHOB|nr:hypothetical protein [Marinibacterium profundimaris]OWU75727.1 hypothetical protein ATO3_05865 [Marinibacterium profundimaris]
MDSYSRRVAFLKVVLPLAALAILSTLFLLSQSADPNATIPFSDAEIAERIRDQQITEPRFAGSTERGDEVSLSADKAVPGTDDEPGAAQNLRGEIRLASGGVITLEAASGWVNLRRDLAEFRGTVTITTDTGYQLVTDRLETAIKRIDATAPGPVAGNGPLGELDAGAMRIMSPDNDPGATHLVFLNGVKLVYDPQSTER